tara:strand:- start:621 stop:800 length:180 start_codon:yes stop_codon:yes gene_type:complete
MTGPRAILHPAKQHKGADQQKDRYVLQDIRAIRAVLPVTIQESTAVLLKIVRRQPIGDH